MTRGLPQFLLVAGLVAVVAVTQSIVATALAIGVCVYLLAQSGAEDPEKQSREKARSGS